MAYLNTAKVHENEVVKADDFDYGFKSFVDNFALGMKLVMLKDSNFIIGGKVKVSTSGGLNLAIEPIYSYCKTSITDIYQCVGNDETTDLVTIVDADSQTRIDIVEVCGQIESYDSEQRAVNDPEKEIKTYPMLDTKQRIKLIAHVKSGTAGSAVAPSTTSGWVKIAEVKVPANATSISESNIYNVTSDVENVENTNWTNEKSSTINIGTISDVNSRFRVEHNEDGSHGNSVIHASNIDFGTGSNQLNGSKVAIGGNTVSIGSGSITSDKKLTEVLSTIAAQFNTMYNSYLKNGAFIFNGALKISSAISGTTLTKPLEIGSAGDGTAYLKINGTTIFTITSDGLIRMASGYTPSNTLDLVTKAVTDALSTRITTNATNITTINNTLADRLIYTNKVFNRFTYVTSSCVAATTGNITLSGTQTIDGVSITAGQIVLVKNQTDAKQNGFYEVVASSSWQRTSSYSTFAAIKNKFFVIPAGTTNKNKIFYTPQETNITLGSSELNFVEYIKSSTEQINDSAITTAKIKDANVTTAKIADANVTTAKIADANVTTAKIADSAITTVKINSSAVTTAKIADANVTSSKLASDCTAPKATILATSRTLNVQDASATNTGTGTSFNGSANATIKLPATIKANFTPTTVTISAATSVTPLADIRYVMTKDVLLSLGTTNVVAGTEITVLCVTAAQISYKNIAGTTLTDDVNASRCLKYIYTGSAWFCSSAPVIGSIHKQLPDEDSPAALYGGVWSEVNYGGAFFRSAGTNAKLFTSSFSAKDSNSGVITFNGSTKPTTTQLAVGDILIYGTEFRTVKTVTQTATSSGIVASVELKEGSFSDYSNLSTVIIGQADLIKAHTHSIGYPAYTSFLVAPGSTYGLRSLSIENSGSTGGIENRPLNITVKIWKRTA